MKRIIYLAITACLLISCENEIPFDINEIPSKLVLNAFLDVDKEENEIILGFTGREEATLVTYDASVDIYINGMHKEHYSAPEEPPIPPDPWLGPVLPFIVKTRLRFLPGDTIRIEARTNDGKHYVWTEVVVPHPVVIERVDTTFVNKLTWNRMETYFRAKTTFTDNANQANYYRICMEALLEIEARNPGFPEYSILHETYSSPLIIREDVVLTDGRPSVEEEEGLLTPVENMYGVFDDSRLNGTYTMTTSMYIPSSMDYLGYPGGYGEKMDVKRISIDMRVKLSSISKEQYLYLKALNIHDSGSYDEYFTPPVKFPSNVNGGTGIVGVSIGSEMIIPLEDYFSQQEEW